MNLVWFLTIATILSTICGEFGQFPFGSPVSISLTDMFLVATLIILLIWKIAIKQEFSLPKEFKILGLFWIFGVVGLIFSGNLVGGLYLVRFIFYSSSFLLGYFLFQDKQINLFDIGRVFVISGFVFLLLGFLQLIIFPNFDILSLLGYDPHQNRLTSTFLDPNFASAYLVITLSLTVGLFFNSKRWEWIVIALLTLIGIGLTFSRSGYLMLIVTFLIFGFLKEKRIILVLGGLLLISLLVPQISERIIHGLTIDSSAKERIGSWQNGLFVFSQSPIFGVGFDNLRSAFAKYNLFKTYSPNGGNSGSGVDSSFILVLATSGILGMIVYVWWWLKILNRSFKFHKSKYKIISILLGCIFLGLFVNSQFINSLFYPPIMLMIYLTAGNLVATNRG